LFDNPMTVRRKIWLSFLAIVVIFVLAVFVAFPQIPKIIKLSFFEKTKINFGLDIQGGTRLIYEADVSQVKDTDKTDAVEGARDVIERRVNAFGVSEPVVQTSKAGGSYRVMVELPGVKDVQQAIKMIGETPLLEFKEQPEFPPMTDEQTKEMEEFNKKAKETADDILKKINKGEDFDALAKEKSEDPGSKEQGGDLGYFQKGQMVPEFETEVFDNLKVGEVSKEPVKTQFGYHIIKKTDERETDKDGEKVKEAKASHILIKIKTETDYQDRAGVDPYGFKNTDLSGKQLKTSAVQFDPNTNEPVVNIEFDEEGSRLFAEITKRNVGKPVAIYLDGQPISVPRVNEEITGGSAVISGQFDLKEAKELSRRLNAGALPVPIKILSQQNIGASLGKDSVEKSIVAGIIGIAAIAFFMILFYRFPGLLAVCALVLYSLIVFAIFKVSSLTSFPITITLAGLAGFVLSIGMAVDANILIFERMKEELRQGKPLYRAMDDGFSRAWLSIRDSNVSSLITCAILYIFGTSIVQGFALSLAIGIAVSMFSAITVTRTLMRLAMGKFIGKHLGLVASGMPKRVEN